MSSEITSIPGIETIFKYVLSSYLSHDDKKNILVVKKASRV